MRPRRFRVSSLAGPIVEIDGPEANHALRVLRLTMADRVILFDQGGHEAEGVIASIGEGAFTVHLTGEIHQPTANSVNLILAVATPKGERADWMIEKCAELGVAAVQWIETSRSVVTPGSGKLDRWRRKAIEAAKQAGRARVMDVFGPIAIARVVEEHATDARILYGEPTEGAVSLSDELERHDADGGARSKWVVVIGPEGGFAEDETRLLREYGAIPVRLADAVLRIETAAVTVAAIFACPAAR